MKTIIFIVLAFLAFAAAATMLVAKDQNTQPDLETALNLFDSSYPSSDNPIVRHRNGLESFCILRDQNQFHEYVVSVIELLSNAFEQDFSTEIVSDLRECSRQMVSFYIFLGDYPGNRGIRSLLTDLTNSVPPARFYHLEGALGATFTIPTAFSSDFIFVQAERPEVPQEQFQAIFLEQLLQAILRASNVVSERMISIYADVYESEDYSVWFDYNSLGFCQLDLIFLELQLGELPAHARRFEGLRRYLEENFTTLNTRARELRMVLGSLVDGRC